MSNRLIAIDWWNSLDESQKSKLIDSILGWKFYIYPNRQLDSVTGREVEIIYNNVTHE